MEAVRPTHPERAKDRVDPCLVTGPLCFEPLENVLIDSQGNGCLGGQGLKPSTNDATNNVTNVGFGMFGGGLSR